MALTKVRGKNKPIAVLILVVMILQCLPLTALASPDANPTTLVGQWHFNEGEGTIATDFSGNSNNGLIGGASRVDGKIGTALSFDGNDYVEIPYNPNLNPRNAITVEAWVNPASNTVWQRVLSKSFHPNTDYSLFSGDKNNIGFSIKMGTVARTAYSPQNSVPIGTWTYVVGTYDGVALKLYINGKRVNCIAVSGEINAHAEPLRIGGDPKGDYFKGMIDEVSIYSCALTAEEILNRYQTAAQVKAPTVLEAVTTINGKKMLVTCDRNMAVLPAAPAGFSVTVDGADNPIQAVSLNSNTTIVELTLANTIYANATNIQLSYTAGTVSSLNGGVLASFSNQNVINNSTAPLVGQWNFNEGEGSIATDFSGNSNNGTIGGATWVNSKMGTALSFDGNDYMEIPYNPMLNPKNAITVEAWVNLASNTVWQRILSKSFHPNTDYSLFSGDKNNIGFSVKMGTVARTAYSPQNSVPIGTWTYVVGTYDGAVLKLYINGKQVNCIAVSGEINAHAEPLRIGGDPKGDYFKGMIDEVSIYSSALTAEEILNRYQTATQATELVDTDNDQMPDIYEKNVLLPAMISKGLELGNPNPDDDYDGDGLSNLEEYNLRTNPSSQDTDDDGISDYDEVYVYFTNPKLYDTDGDGMGDGTEIINGLNPLVKDTDGNGTIDSQEIFNQKLINSKYDNIDIAVTKVKPFLSITGSGDYSKQIEIKDASLNKSFSEINSLVGNPFEIAHNSGLSFQNASISFKISDEVLQTHNLQDLVVAWYNTEDNTLTTLDSEIDEANNTISANVEHFSYYCVIDKLVYYYGLDLDNSDSIIAMGKADVVFVVDTTGSMAGAIQNVKNNINSVVDRLKEKNVDVRLGLVEYRDITVDGPDSTKDLGWFTDVGDFKTRVSALSVGGGGDTPESAIDALEVARNKDFRMSVNKYIILVTDADYKIANTFGLIFMEDEIVLLKNDGINVSVVSKTIYQDTYADLYNLTNGIFADIKLNFVTALESLITRMGEQVNDGVWVRLSNGTLVKLAADPKLGNYGVDTDGDGIPDLIELNEEQEKTYYDFFTSTMKTVKYWTFTTNPIRKDTDWDGIDDGLDINPTEYDVCIKEYTDDYVVFNNGQKWLMFKTDVYEYFSRMYISWAGNLKDPDLAVQMNILKSNSKLILTPEEIAFLATVDINGVRYYLNDKNKSVRNQVFKILTGAEPKYYKHTWTNTWVEIEPKEEDWTDFFSGDIKSEADATLTLDYDVDLNQVITGIVFIGVIAGATYLVIGEVVLIVEGCSIYGVYNAMTMYTCGGSQLLKANLDYLKQLRITPPVWVAITPTQEVYSGTKIPKSFEIQLQDKRLWVHPNATKHMEEYINRLGERATNIVSSQQMLNSFKNDLQIAIESGYEYETIIRINNWEFIISSPRELGLLEVVKHAQYFP